LIGDEAVSYVDKDHVDNDAIEHISDMFGSEKSSFVHNQSQMWNKIKGIPAKEVPVAKSSNKTFRDTLCNTSTNRVLFTAKTTENTESRSTWDEVTYLDEQEKSNMKELEQYLSLQNAETIPPVYRNILDYTKSLVLAAEEDREADNDVTCTENFVKLLAKLAAVLHEIDVYSLSLDSQNREKTYARIKSIMKYKKQTKNTSSLYLLTWLNTRNIDAFTLTYGEMNGFHFCIAFLVWKKKHFPSHE